MVVFVAVKSLAIGITAALLDVTFLRALILVLVSAIVTGMFALVVAHIQSKADVRQHQRLDYLESRLDDVAGSVGANKRSTDPDASRQTPAA